jgi:Tfp pilus assembly protein PilV
MKPVTAKRATGGWRRTKGFTLVEVLLAFLVLMLGIIAVLSLFPVGMKLSQDMVQTSTAALVAKNVRGCMEATDLADVLTPMSGITPSITRNNFPCYFPGDMGGIANTFVAAISNNQVKPTITATILNSGASNARVTDTANPLYSWDARFSVGQGGFRNPPWSFGIAGGWTIQDTNGWFDKYFRFYVVDISVYRSYQETGLGSGTIQLLNTPTANDANLIPTCELTLSTTPPADLEVGWFIRIPSDRSAWYRVEKITGKILTLDRMYAGPDGTPYTADDAGSKSGIVATGSLVGSFTTFLAAYND